MSMQDWTDLALCRVSVHYTGAFTHTDVRVLKGQHSPPPPPRLSYQCQTRVRGPSQQQATVDPKTEVHAQQ